MRERRIFPNRNVFKTGITDFFPGPGMLRLALSVFAAGCMTVRGELFASPDEGGARLRYNNPGLVVDLGLGLWAVPLPMDYTGNGVYDLVAASGGRPDRGSYFFENDGSGVFRPAIRLSESASANMAVSETANGTFVTWPGKAGGPTCRVWSDFIKGTDTPFSYVPFTQDFYAGRQNMWRFGDVDGDGIDDLYFGTDDWRDYGWDDSFNSKGEWMAGPLRGYVYWSKNAGSNEKPVYLPSQKIEPIETYGFPSPVLVDWNGNGKMDFLCTEFLDRITFYENIGTRTEPRYAPGRFLELDGEILRLELQMPILSSVDWNGNGRPDLIVGKEDGRVVYIENLGGGKIAPPVYLKQQADRIKCGALVTPDGVDWDGDGDIDILTGDTAGFVSFIENLGGGSNPVWAAPVRLKARGEEIRIQAGPNGSIQGPCEAKWGYSVVGTGDWDGGGRIDLVLNGIDGRIIWYKNTGRPGAPELDGPFPVEVAWPEGQKPPKPPWNWRDPEPNELSVQWRTRPDVIDLDGDGLMDLVTLDHEGYLAWYRKRPDGRLEPGQRIFRMADGEPCVFDNNTNPIWYDQNNDGINDLTQITAKGETVYLGRTHSYDGPRRNYLQTKSESLEGKAFAVSGNTGNLLRANCGWAGRSGRSKYQLVDWNGNGKLDLLVNTQNIGWFENVGNDGEFLFVRRGNLVQEVLAGHTTCPAVIDFTGDGVPDLLIGAEDGYFYHYPRTDYAEMPGIQP